MQVAKRVCRAQRATTPARETGALGTPMLCPYETFRSTKESRVARDSGRNDNARLCSCSAGILPALLTFARPDVKTPAGSRRYKSCEAGIRQVAKYCRRTQRAVPLWKNLRRVALRACPSSKSLLHLSLHLYFEAIAGDVSGR